MFTMTGPHGGMLIKAVAPMAGAGAASGSGTQGFTGRHLMRMLVGALTRHDEQEQKTRHNIYRLGHYLKAVEGIEKDVGSTLDQDLSDPKVAHAVLASMDRNFTREPGQRFYLPPAAKAADAILHYQQTGTRPSYDMKGVPKAKNHDAQVALEKPKGEAPAYEPQADDQKWAERIAGYSDRDLQHTIGLSQKDVRDARPGSSDHALRAWQLARLQDEAGRRAAKGKAAPDAKPAAEPAPAASATPIPDEHPDGVYRIGPAHYSKGMVAVQTPGKGGYKDRAARLAESLSNGRHSHREHAYIMSPTKAEKFKRLYAEGWDASYGGKLEAPEPKGANEPAKSPEANTPAISPKGAVAHAPHPGGPPRLTAMSRDREKFEAQFQSMRAYTQRLFQHLKDEKVIPAESTLDDPGNRHPMIRVPGVADIGLGPNGGELTVAARGEQYHAPALIPGWEARGKGLVAAIRDAVAGKRLDQIDEAARRSLKTENQQPTAHQPTEGDTRWAQELHASSIEDLRNEQAHIHFSKTGGPVNPTEREAWRQWRLAEIKKVIASKNQIHLPDRAPATPAPAPTPAPSAEAPRASDAAEPPAAPQAQHAIAVGPRGGRYVAGSEKRDAKGRKIRRYVGKDEPGTGRQAAQKNDPRYQRWSENVRVRGGRDQRLPAAGTQMTRYFKGQAVKVSEGEDGQFHVHLDGQHAASGRSLTGALSKALGRAVSGYGFMRLGGAQEGPAVKDWDRVKEAKGRLAQEVFGMPGMASGKIVATEHFRDGVRVHVHHGEDHYLIEGDRNGWIRETGGKRHVWKVEGNRYVRVDQIGGKGADKAPEPDKAPEQAQPEAQVSASVADRIQSDPIGLAADVQAMEAMSEPELRALDQAIYERGRRMSRSGDYTSEQVSANDDASLAVATRLSEIANRRAAEPKPEKPATDSTNFTAKDDAKHGVMPAADLMAHLTEHGFHDPVAAQGFVGMIDEYGDQMKSEAMKHDPSTVMAAARFQPGDIVLPIGPADEDAAYESALRHGTYKKLWPTATYDPTTDTITRTIAGQTETKPVHEFVPELRGHKIGRKYAHDASEASFATHGGTTPYRVESVGKDGMLTIRGVHGHGQNKTFKIHPDIGKMARYADERMERIMAAFDAGRIDLDGQGKGNPRSLSPEARNALRKMSAADLEALAPDASAAASATKGKESPHQKRLNKVVSGLTKYAHNLSNFGVPGSELEIRIHPDAVVLAHKDSGEQFAAVEHDMPVTEPDAIAAKRVGLSNVSNIRHVATPHFGAEKSRRDWSYVEDGILVLHDYAFRREAPQPPDGFEAVIFDPNRDEWMAVKSLDLAGLADGADRQRLPLL